MRRIGNYQLRKLIGRGGMGEVHLAWDEDLQRNVAIKLIRDELSDQPNRLRRLSREARTVAQLNHPGIVHLYHVIPTDNSQALVMEWVEGETLRDLLRRRKSLPTSEAIPIFLQLTEALSFAHEAGFVHRDLKPQNIMITESQQAKILDFGLAKSLEPDLSTLSDEGKILGTFSFMSPEQTAGEDVGAASDLFSLGVVFYETVTGQRPFDGKNVAETLNRICHKKHLDPREITPELPNALAELINNMLEKAAYRRPKNAAEIGNVLASLDNLKREASDLSTWRSPRIIPPTSEPVPGPADSETSDPKTQYQETHQQESRDHEEPNPAVSERLAPRLKRSVLLPIIALLFTAAGFTGYRLLFPEDPTLLFAGFQTDESARISARLWDEVIHHALESSDGLSMRRVQAPARTGEMTTSSDTPSGDNWRADDLSYLVHQYGIDYLLIGSATPVPPNLRLELHMHRRVGPSKSWSVDASDPPSVEDLLRLVDTVRVDQGALPWSADELGSLVKMWPDSSEHENLGHALQAQKKGRPESALDWLERIDGDSLSVKALRARALHRLGRFAEAANLADQLLTAIEAAPPSAQTWTSTALEIKQDFSTLAEYWQGQARRHPHRADFELLQAAALNQAGQTEQAEQILKYLPQNLPQHDARNRMLQLGRAGLQQGRAEDALNLARALSNQSELPLSQRTAARLLEGTALERLNRFDEAMEALDRSRADAELLSDLDGLLKVFLEMGVVAARRGDQEDAVRRFTAYAETYRAQGRHWAAAVVNANLASVLINLGRSQDAIPLLRDAVPELRRNGRPIEVAIAVTNLGSALHLVGNLDEAKTAYLEALEALSVADDPLSRAAVLTNLGEVSLLRANPSEALDFHHRALEINLAMDPASANYDRLRVAEAQHQAGRFQEARELFEILTDDSAAGPSIAAEARLGLARLHLDLQNLGEADRLARLAEENLWQLGFADHAVRAQLTRAAVECMRGRMQNSDELIAKARLHTDLSPHPALPLETRIQSLQCRLMSAPLDALESICSEARDLHERAAAIGFELLSFEARRLQADSCFPLQSQDRRTFLRSLSQDAQQRGLGRLDRDEILLGLTPSSEIE